MLKIQSPYLLKELRPFLEKHQVKFDDENAIIKRPFSVLFFERDHIHELSKRMEEDEQTKEHLELLCKIINEELGTTIDDFETLEPEKKITHDLLWTLFPPGTFVISAARPYHQGYRVARTPMYINDHADNYMYAECEYVKFDGLQYGIVTTLVIFPHFEGKQEISKLNAFPSTLDEYSEDLRDRLIQRGEMVLRYQDVHYMQGGPLSRDTEAVQYDEVVKDIWKGQVSIFVYQNSQILIFGLLRLAAESLSTPMPTSERMQPRGRRLNLYPNTTRMRMASLLTRGPRKCARQISRRIRIVD